MMSDMKSVSNIMGLLAAVLISVSAVVSCGRIIEDRSDCPTWLTIDWSRCVDYGDLVSDSLYFDEKVYYADDDINIQSNPRKTYVVPRGAMNFITWWGVEGCVMSDGAFTVPRGSEMSRLWLYGHPGMTVDGESQVEVVEPWKQYCLLTIKFVDWLGVVKDADAVVYSTSCGMRLADLSAVRGDFCAKASLIGEGQFSVRVPRQGFHDLVLVLRDASGNVVCRYDLSSIIDEVGYDWTEKSLKDINLFLSVAGSGTDIQIGDWDKGADHQ